MQGQPLGSAQISTIGKSMQGLQSVVAQLDDIISNLTSRLMPVLGSSEPKLDRQQTVAATNPVSLAADIDTIEARIRHSTENLNDIIARLGV
jgi:hypothetical protein